MVIHRRLEGEMKKDASPSGPTARKDRSDVLPLKGEIDLHVSPSVTASLNAMIEKKPRRLVVDLSDVTYIDSAGLAALIQAMQKVEGYGGKFLLAGLQETVRSIFEISRLDQVFQIFPDVHAALAN
jgi:anti-anti-sigma factor